MADRKKIAVVLGGGGLKPYASLPLFTYLKEKNLEIDLLVGCSGGAIIAALIGSGYSPDEIQKDFVTRIQKSLFKRNWRAILSFANLPFSKMDRTSALFNPERLVNLLREFMGNKRIEECSPRTIFQATDYLTGEGFSIEKGDLVSCVNASAALFPFFPPVQLGGKWLFDGGFSAPVPVLQAIKFGADVVIVVDFLEKIQPDPQGAFQTMIHISNLLAKTIVRQQMALSIALHHAEIFYIKVNFERDISIWQTECLPEILEAGKLALEKSKAELELLLMPDLPGVPPS